MGEIGAGAGSSYPGSLDTNSNLEVDDPSASRTLARAAVPNDLAAGLVAVETELGTDPAGSLTDVKTYLQTEHNTDGTHNGSTTVVTKTATQTLTNKTLTSPVLGGTATGTYTLGGTPTITAPAITGNWGGGTMTSGTVTLARIGVSGSYTTASLASGATDSREITHSLGTDSVQVLVMAKGNTASANYDFVGGYERPDGTVNMFGRFTSDPSGFTLGATTGTVRFSVKNVNASSQTITVNYTILRES